MNTNTTALRVFTLSDGRRVKEVPEVSACRGCMFDLGPPPVCARPDEQSELEGCCATRGTIYQPADPAFEPVAVAEPVKRAYAAKHISLKQRSDRKMILTLELDAVETSSQYWVTTSDARGKCSTPGGCSAHGCHGECLGGTDAQPAKREPLKDEQIASMWNAGYSDVSGESMVNVFARAIERAHGIGQQDKVDEPARRKPVEGGVVMAMFHMAGGGFMPSLEHAYRRGFRDAEKAHGIGGQDKGADHA